MNSAWKRHFGKLMNLWPPFLGAGIRVKRISADWKEVDLEMKLRWWNSNYVGTHYGGSLYSITDPFYMIMLMENLGSDYQVWDKAATVNFRKPGRGTVFVQFRLRGEQIEQIRQTLSVEKKMELAFPVEVKDATGAVIAQIEKLVHIRKKQQRPAEESAAGRSASQKI